MLKQLRTKIIAIVMAISGAVLIVSFAAMLAMNYNDEYRQIRENLARSVEHGPAQETAFSIGRGADRSRTSAEDGEDRTDHHSDGLGADQTGGDYDGADEQYGRQPSKTNDDRFPGFAPTAVFLVNVDGTVLQDNGAFVTMDTETASEAIGFVLASDADEGFVSSADVYYLRSARSDGTYVIAFADALPLRESMTDIATNMLFVGAFVLIVLFCASALLARVATRPVERAWEQQQRFIADASHELKTPLTVILANTEILLSESKSMPQDSAHWLESTQEEAERMKDLIEEMLTLAQSDEMGAAEQNQHSPVDLSDIVMRACLAFDVVAFESGIVIDEQVDDSIFVNGNAEHLERLTKTLIDNAVKYAGPEGRVVVTLSQAHGKATLTVNNTGPAIPPDDLAHVFDRFWRSDSARTHVGKGSYGLGLAIAKSIAEVHGATIGAESSEQSGTTFTVTFPVLHTA